MDSQPEASAPPLLTRNFLCLLGAGFLCFTALGIFYLFPLFVINLGGSKSDIGILMGVMALSAVCVRPWVSGLVDQLNRKTTFAIGCALIALISGAHIYVVAPIDRIFYLLVLMRFIFGIGLGFIIVSSMTLASDLTPPRRLNEGLGIFGVMPLLGIATGPVIGEAIIASWGFTGMFLLTIGACALTVLFLIPIIEPIREKTDQRKDSFFTVLATPVVWRIGLVIITFGIAFAAHGSFVAPFAESRSLSVSIYFITYSAAAVISRLFGGRLSSYCGEYKMILASLLGMGAGFLLLAQTSSNIGLVASGLLAGAGQGIFFPSVLAFSVRSVKSGDRGKITGIITGGVDTGMLIGSFSLGYLGDLFGFPVLFTVAAFCVLVGVFLFIFMRKTIMLPKDGPIKAP
ncbi:MAG: MFS transporter [Desulfobulbaceae bacterium]|nr:MFS transporter [Desulfobulbaceae bacterium]